MHESQLALELVKWIDIKEKVYKINQPLAAIIDAINPGNNFVFYKASYRFGSTIINKSKFNVPTTNNSFLPLDHPSISDELQEKLGYSKYNTT